ncbi:orotate phosphoribosyltransferase [Nocardia sp. NPDC088792]|uniref:orotate phosphoribosyltransferase n=1 Tax=Nocardia sp. NPDC088792 TaxID=3364332 RepID=UPI003818B3BF
MTAELVFQNTAERSRELAQDIVSAAHLTGDFVLSSGGRSSYYFDKYLFETKPTILRRLASALAERIPASVDRLAGPELGAVALVTAVSLETGLPFVIVRKASKGYGTSRFIEGELHRGERVLIIEDIISTGSEALKAAAQVERAGGDITGILAVIDRGHGGAENISAAGYRLEALYDRSGLPTPDHERSNR